MYFQHTSKILLVCLVLGSGLSDPVARSRRRKRVIGGRALEEGMFPWLSHLSATIPSEYWYGFPIAFEGYNCGGSILHEHWILTAAHCFSVPGAQAGILDPSNWFVTVGQVNAQPTLLDLMWDMVGSVLSEPRMRMWSLRAEHIILHPHYDPDDTWLHDIALVRVSEALPIGPEHTGISQVNLPSPRLGGSEDYASLWPRDQSCVMKGWGCSAAGGPPERIARGVLMPVVEESDCPFQPVGDSRLCAGYNTLSPFSSFLFPGPDQVGICPGDSGGPLVCQYKGVWLQAGVASYTSANMPGRVPGVFTRVSYYVDWLEETILEYERNIQNAQ